MSLYPSDPSVGSPFGTGNETYDTGPGYKQGAAISMASHALLNHLTLKCHYRLVGDLWLQAPRRFWSQTANARSYAYIFTEPQHAYPSLGVYHSSELPYFYPSSTKNLNWQSTTRLSRVMLDYWISFAVSLTPNDGKGMNSMFSHTFLFVLHLIGGPSGPYWEEYKEAEVWYSDSACGKTFNLV